MDFIRQAVDKLDNQQGNGQNQNQQHHQQQGYNQQQGGYPQQNYQNQGGYQGEQRYDSAPLRPDQTSSSAGGVGGLAQSFLNFSNTGSRDERAGLQPVALPDHHNPQQQYQGYPNQSTHASGGGSGLLGTVKDMFDGGDSRRREEEERRRLEEEERMRREEGGLMGKVGGLMSGFTGGSAKKDEDFIDKGVDLVQQHVLGQGEQKNESVLEQMKDAQIANMVRGALGKK